MSATRRHLRRFRAQDAVGAASLLMVATLLCAACSPPPRKQISDAQLLEMARTDAQNEHKEFHETITGLLARADRKAKAAASGGGPATLNFRCRRQLRWRGRSRW